MLNLIKNQGRMCLAAFALCPLVPTQALYAQETVTTPGGTVNVVPKYSGSATIINSAIFESGGKVGIGTTSPSSNLTVKGTLNSSGISILDNAFRFYSGNFDGVKTYSDFRLETSAPNLVINAPSGGVVFNYDHGTGGVEFANGAGGILAQITAAGNAIFAGTGNSSFAGSLGIGTTSPSSKLTVAGVVQSTTGGFKFPDGSVQTTALKGGGLSSVSHDTTLTGSGTTASPLGVSQNLVLGGSPGPAELTLNGFGTTLVVNDMCQDGSCGESAALGVVGGDGDYGIQAYGGDADGGGTLGMAAGVFTGGNGFFPGFPAGDGIDSTGGFGNGGNGGNGITATGSDGSNIGCSGSGCPFMSGGAGILALSGQNSDGTYADAGDFEGNVDVVGNLSKSGGSFKIDHPLDPANKYLYHSFVESPDMMNVYNGNIVTDGGGMATVTLPEWFEALNRDFRYQLTVIGGQFAQAIVASEMQNHEFTIRTDKPSVKVSWQVTGIRQDAWANAHRIPVEQDKAETERGYYIHPELYNEPPQKSIAYADHPQLMKQLEAKHAHH